MVLSVTHTLTGILLVYVVVLNMVLSNMIYLQRFRHNASVGYIQPYAHSLRSVRSVVMSANTSPALEHMHASTTPAPRNKPALLVLVLIHSSPHTAAAPVVRLLMQLRVVSWHITPRIALVMQPAHAMTSYNDWCLLTELQCDIAVLSDTTAAGLAQYIHNTDMCCTSAGIPTHNVLLLHDTTSVRRGFAQTLRRAASGQVSCLQGSPCQAFYIPAQFISYNGSRWGS